MEKFQHFRGIAENISDIILQSDSSKMRNVYEWCSEGIIPQIQNLQDVELEKQVPFFTKMVTLRRAFYAYDIEDLPAEADPDKEHFRSQDIKSLFVVPMYYQNEIWGFVGFDFAQYLKIILPVKASRQRFSLMK